MKSEDHERLAKESEFQNRRVQAMHQGEKEPRDRFYYLSNRAEKDYQSRLQDVVDKFVIVVGCSEGGVTPLAKRGAKVIGIDIADVAIDKLNIAIARENLAELASARVMDAHNLDVDDDSVDIICCSGVLHHLDTESAARSWSKKLITTGKVIMLEPMAMNPIIALYRKFTPSMRTEDEHPLLPKDINILRKYFECVELKGYVLTSLFSVFWTFLPKSDAFKETTQRYLEYFDDWLLTRLPGLVYLCWTCVIVLSKPRR